MRKRVNKQTTLPALIVVALLVFGCTKKEAPPPQPPQPKTVAKPVQPVPVQVQATSSRTPGAVSTLLDFNGKKDPFKPFAEAHAPQAQAKPAPSVRTGDILPIQSYEVSKFRISGIITGLKENTALIIDPAGRGYVVREGMMIGIYDGRITKITPSAIVVVEQYRDDNHHLRKRNIILTLPKKK